MQILNELAPDIKPSRYNICENYLSTSAPQPTDYVGKYIYSVKRLLECLFIKCCLFKLVLLLLLKCLPPSTVVRKYPFLSLQNPVRLRGQVPVASVLLPEYGNWSNTRLNWRTGRKVTLMDPWVLNIPQSLIDTRPFFVKSINPK